MRYKKRLRSKCTILEPTNNNVHYKDIGKYLLAAILLIMVVILCMKLIINVYFLYGIINLCTCLPIRKIFKLKHSERPPLPSKTPCGCLIKNRDTGSKYRINVKVSLNFSTTLKRS